MNKQLEDDSVDYVKFARTCIAFVFVLFAIGTVWMGFWFCGWVGIESWAFFPGVFTAIAALIGSIGAAIYFAPI